MTYQAIVTKYHGPTNTRGPRIIATSESGERASIPYPHELNHEEAHIEAAQKLCDKLGWNHKRACGSIKGGYAHVLLDD